MEALKLQNLSKYYASQSSVVMGLSNINLSFSTGEFVAVTGENGSGKSTLANVIGGMLSYESGELFVMGQPTSHYNAADWERYRRDLIGFISQDYGILPGNTVFENVESALILSGCEKVLAKEKTRDILTKVELSAYAKRRAAKLSSGQKQRLAIARALAKPSKILIADEPTGNLDRENSDKVVKLLHEAAQERLVIIITHEFDEVQDYITRHVVLSDGKVIQDVELGARPEMAAEKAPEKEQRKKNAAGKGLAAYIARLTAKARPVFFCLTALILILTCIASFIFVGNFIIATDDTSTRVYDASAFVNGDKTRLVLVKNGREAFTDEEIAQLNELNYVRRVEKYGYVSDVNYYYREDVDFRAFSSNDYAADYDPISNPDAYSRSVKIELLPDDPKFVRSVSQAGKITKGRMAEGFYEVLSSDPALKTGMQVRVYIRDKLHWGVSQKIALTFDVVGETDGSRGLYFSESFCRMLSGTTLARIYNFANVTFVGGDLSKYLVAPYDEGRFLDVLEPLVEDKTELLVENKTEPTPEPTPEASAEPTPEATPEVTPKLPDAPGENEYLIPPDSSGRGNQVGSPFTLSVGSWYTGGKNDRDDEESMKYKLVCVGNFKSDHPRLVLLNPKTFEKMTSGMGSNQASVFIRDYAYTQRVTDELTARGYVVVSPYTQGSTTKNETLETERINLLRICLAASVLTIVLQIILLVVTFSSLKDHYRLLSNMGLRSKTAYASLALLFLFLTLLAEIVSAAVILLLNRYGYVRVVNIFKYLDPSRLILILAIFVAACAATYLIVARSIKKQVFTIKGFYEDMDGELMEEVMGQ